MPLGTQNPLGTRPRARHPLPGPPPSPALGRATSNSNATAGPIVSEETVAFLMVGLSSLVLWNLCFQETTGFPFHFRGCF